jgi:tetratricopeptide (TPR) repeat protein
MSRRFRIAFSFAGEKRDFVSDVAALLARQFDEDAILYDKYHEAEFAVFDLGIRLPKLYGEQSDLIVPVLCPDYDTKRWTGWEWVHIYGLLTREDGHRVMPCRFELANADGLSPASGFVELDDKTPEQFATLILERLALNEGLPKDHYIAEPALAAGDAPRTLIPHNLPSLQPFFGREDELARIADALDPESRTWGALIDGPGGMGKTSLAVRAAYGCGPEQFDRIAFVSLKSRELDDDGERDLSGFLISGINELLNELARELGHDHIAKAVEDERPRLLLDALRGTKTLLILDNLESLLKRERDTVFTFVKKLPPGCKAILTSRRRIGSAAEELILEKLSEAAALATLARLAETSPALQKTTHAERRELYEQTAGKPLLLRWTAGQIGRGSCVTLADAIAHLKKCPEVNDPLEFIFGDLVEDFSESETYALCALTYFTLPARVEHLATVAGRDEAETELALKSLINRSLVVPSDELQTFTLVPLVADFLRVKRAEVLRKTGDRLEEHAYELVVENGFKNHDRFSVLDNAWPTVAAALPRFVAGDYQRLQTVCAALITFFEFTGRWDEWLAFSRDAEGRSVATGDLMSAGWLAASGTGYIHSLRGESDEVLASAGRAEAHWREAKCDAREQALAIRLRGIGHRLATDYPAAIAAFREVIEILRSLDAESEDVAIVLNDLAEAEQSSGDLDAAEHDYRQALRIAQAVNRSEMIAGIPGSLANLALDREDWPAAETLVVCLSPFEHYQGQLWLERLFRGWFQQWRSR